MSEIACKNGHAMSRKDTFCPYCGERPAYYDGKPQYYLGPENLYQNGVGGFATNISYWSSTESLSVFGRAAWSHFFLSDGQNNTGKSFGLNVRAIRSF